MSFVIQTVLKFEFLDSSITQGHIQDILEHKDAIHTNKMNCPLTTHYCWVLTGCNVKSKNG